MCALSTLIRSEQSSSSVVVVAFVFRGYNRSARFAAPLHLLQHIVCSSREQQTDSAPLGHPINVPSPSSRLLIKHYGQKEDPDYEDSRRT
ncbi:unnamed protein product [Toxocara canis]|uniref:DET1- and DDB1-associated protein 1 n=1 Tax=Toxocara canis TaxID=6265 RepID=A0A183TWC6_TOXCA|nr:unnamed protein product [Toxocara canis]